MLFFVKNIAKRSKQEGAAGQKNLNSGGLVVVIGSVSAKFKK